MEIESATQQQARGLLKRAYEWPKALPGYVKDKAIRVARNTTKLGRDDPRRVIHSIKVGIAITLVSFLYYSRPLYDDFGVAGMWAVLTVVVVFEFTAGGTLGKSINRGCATLAAGALGVGAEHLASLFGQTGEPIVLGILVFLLAATSTFTRFFPQVKARYDYGVLVFILTFSMVSVSGYRVEELLVMAHQRLSTIIIGGATCVLVSLCICPVWAGEDLHNLVASNIEKLANYLECFGSEYFYYSENGESVEISNSHKSLILQEYKSVLGSKSTEEILANLARWEPRHGHFRRKHPWKQYLKIGALSRQCAYQIEALNGYVNSNFKSCPKDFQGRIQESCKKMSEESSKALKSLATSMKSMTHPISANPHVENSIIAIRDLKLALKACPLDPAELLAIVPTATVASILIEIVHCVEKLSQSVQELSNLAHFKVIEDTQLPKKSPSLQRCSSMKPGVGGDGRDHVIIEIQETTKDEVNTLETKADP